MESIPSQDTRCWDDRIASETIHQTRRVLSAPKKASFVSVPLRLQDGAYFKME